MGITIADIIGCLDEIAPFGMAESWDNVGLIIGDRRRQVSTIIVGLDPTNQLLDEALSRIADTVITHHPAIFKPIPSIDTGDPCGRFLEKALSNQLNIIACHTNFDSVSRGVNDALAELLGLEDVRPLIPAGPEFPNVGGMGRIGRYSPGKKKSEFIELLLDVLDLPAVQMAGELPDTIANVALCGGSGSDLTEAAGRSGADVYVSAEIKHNIGRWVEESGFCVIDGTHYATEKPAVKLLAEQLRIHSREQRWHIEILETETENHPFSMVDRDSYYNTTIKGESS